MTAGTKFDKSARLKTIVYWVSTVWLALGMLSTGTVQFMHMKEEADNISRLGYPVYLLTLLGFWKVLGTAAILIPKFPLVKEWAYAGFFFAMSGAAFSRISAGSSITEIFPSLLLLVLTLVSWYCRPASRKPSSSAKTVETPANY